MEEDAPAQGVKRSGTTASVVGRLRSETVSAAERLLEYNPARGMWMATGTAIAHAPNLTDLRSPVGGDRIVFDSHGKSARDGSAEELKNEIIVERRATITSIDLKNAMRTTEASDDQDSTILEQAVTESEADLLPPKASWPQATKHGLYAFWKFLITPTGFLITLYGINVVGWGAMLFFLLLKVGPMQGNTQLSQRKVWLEIDSQILNALFCVTGFGLAPWRFRDLYWLWTWRLRSGIVSKKAIHHLAHRNTSWFRLRESDMDDNDINIAHFHHMQTFTGEVVPPTASWKMDFVVINMVLNTLFQVGMATFMWHYNRFNRPSFGVGLFIGLASTIEGLYTLCCFICHVGKFETPS